MLPILLKNEDHNIRRWQKRSVVIESLENSSHFSIRYLVHISVI